MSSLYYANLPDCYRPEIVMSIVTDRLREFADYLHSAKRAIEKTAFRIKWIEIINTEEKIEDYKGMLENEDIEELSPETQAERFDGYLGEVNVFENDIDKSDDIFNELSRSNHVYERDSGRDLRIQIIEYDQERNLLKLKRRPNTEVLYVKQSTYQLIRQIQALEALQNTPKPHHRPLIRLLENKDKSSWPEVRVRNVNNWFLLTDLNRPGTYEQRKFVNIALSTPDFAILEGPPGTGKTTAICEFILQAIKEKKKVMLCASTHVAVDNVLEKLHELGKLDKDVIAVRIGDKNKVSELVQHVQIENREKTDKKNITEFLSKIPKRERTESQQYLLDALKSDRGNSLITNLILESANLVCGTTIGILQHNEIKRNIRDTRPLFDYLVIDEASKTTFQEFLVPALYAKRWILVGDPKQLSPYVERVHIESNISNLLKQDYQKICLNTFMAKKGHHQVIYEEDLEIIDIYKMQAYALGLEIVEAYIDKEARIQTIPRPIDVLGADIIIGNLEGIKLIKNYIPIDFEINNDNSDFELNRRRYNYWLKTKKRREKEWENTWGQEIAWRMIRYFEKRKDDENRSFYLQDIEDLLPKWGGKELDDVNYDNNNQEGLNLEFRRLKREIDNIRAIALPSIIELLQEGFERHGKNRRSNVLRDGFDEMDLRQRHVLLEYQHRMHPEISKFPRERIYKKQSLLDPNYIKSERDWKYSKYQRRCIWINVLGKKDKRRNFNEKEIETIMEELKEFRDWAKKNPKIDPITNEIKPWEIAVLSFYKYQEYKLRKKIRRFFNTKYGYVNFKKKNWNINLKLCTVDRFQGHEADIVFLSFVQTNRPGFLDSPNRLNVAITRARYQLVLIGKRTYFENQNRSDLLKQLAKTIEHEFRFGEK
ncbi:MAG: AAA domain-containing protein [Candidatus Heimdallarchaeaceae archaeon]